MTDLFWDQLLSLIDEGQVVPVVGQDLLTVPESTGHAHLYAYLAERLATYLRVSAEDLPRGLELNEVACRYLAKGKPSQHIYAGLKSVAAETTALPVPASLQQLAAIPRFPLFVTTTFDGFMARAIDEARPGVQPRARVFAHAPTEVEDLPGDLGSLGGPLVYHLLGRLSATPAYAVTQEDLIEFFHSLQSERRPAALLHELSRRSLLLLGTRFSGWLTSFLMRMSKGQRLSADEQADYVADDVVSRDETLVLFLERCSRDTEIFSDGDAVAFVDELHRRWSERHPDAGLSPRADQQVGPGSSNAEPGAVFLSYASEDVAAVERLKTALEASGVDVFFDRDDLHAGEDWKIKLRRSIDRCSLFVPIISRNTLTSDRRFFRREWRLALQEAQEASFSVDEAFLFPVVIDDTTTSAEGLPQQFRDIQWMSLPGGEPTSYFLDRVKTLHRAYHLRQAGAA